jgi:nucleoporin NUP159
LQAKQASQEEGEKEVQEEERVQEEGEEEFRGEREAQGEEKVQEEGDEGPQKEKKAQEEEGAQEEGVQKEKKAQEEERVQEEGEEEVQEEKKAQEEEEVESDLDFDNEYDDYDPDRVRNKLLNSDVKPVQELPKFRRNGEVEVASDFNAVFDSIYLSGNMMINRLGLTVQGLKAYHLGQENPLPDVEHKTAKEMRHPLDWRFCEMDQVKEILEQLLASVKGENQGNDELEARYQAASKGFIKLDVKDAEIKRLLAVHNDAQAAAIARARPLTPEQVLQQRKLRKEYAKVERLLKEAEKEVTQLKAKIASRDRDRPGAVVPPTVEAVKNTIMKLTGMVERKNGDIDYLEERLRRVKIKSRSASATPGKSRGLTPNQTPRGETPQRFETPEKLRSYDNNTSSVSYPASPVLALADPLDVEEAREEIRARKEMGRKMRDALEICGPKLTTVSRWSGEN